MGRVRSLDQETWWRVRSAIARAAREAPPPPRRFRYPDTLILAMCLWGVWQGRCLSWACFREHDGPLLRPRKLPSVSQFTRRVKAGRTQALRQRVHELLAAEPAAGSAASGASGASGGGYLDGKPLTVSPASKDPDARRGRVGGGFARGYKLHALVTPARRVRLRSVAALPVAEQSVAVALCPHLPPQAAQSVVLADSHYDSAPLHRRSTRGGRRCSRRSRPKRGSRAGSTTP